MAPLDATGRRQQETPVSRGFLDFLGLAWIGIWQPRMDPKLHSNNLFIMKYLVSFSRAYRQTYRSKSQASNDPYWTALN